MQPDTITTIAPSWYRSLKARNLSERTVESYALAVNQLANHVNGKAVAKIERADIEDYLGEVLENRSGATARQRFASLQQFFQWLEDEGEIPTDPMARMRPPQVHTPLVPVLSKAELKLLADTARLHGANEFEHRRNHAIIMMLADTGARLGEIAGMQTDHVDIDRGWFIVPKAKNREARTVPFGNNTAAALDRYERARRRHHSSDLPWYWVGRKGRLNDTGIAQVVARVSMEAGLGRINPHRFRHSFAHHYLNDGGQEGDLTQIAGWKSRQMLARYGKSAASQRAIKAAHQRSIGDNL